MHIHTHRRHPSNQQCRKQNATARAATTYTTTTRAAATLAGASHEVNLRTTDGGHLHLIELSPRAW